MTAEIAAEPTQHLSSARTAAEQSLLARFGEAFENGTRQAQAIADPATRELGAARIALEHAILQTAQEKETAAPDSEAESSVLLPSAADEPGSAGHDLNEASL